MKSAIDEVGSRNVAELCQKVKDNQESRRPTSLTDACEHFGVSKSVYFR